MENALSMALRVRFRNLMDGGCALRRQIVEADQLHIACDPETVTIDTTGRGSRGYCG